jgi:hypothetical protein
MRSARYRFPHGVRAATRAIALRMLHAKSVAASSEELHAWIMRTEDLRETLTKGGYGSTVTADDLYALFQASVARATNATVARSKTAPPMWVWFAASAVIVLGIIMAVIVILG